MIEAMKQWLEVLEYWDIHGGLNQPTEDAIASLRQAIADLESQEPVAFKIYKPTPPRHAMPNVRDAELPWVYDQDPSSGNVASMWVTPVKHTHPPQRTEPVATVTSETGADITMSWWHEPALPVGTKLFTYAPQRKPLTDEQAHRILMDMANHIEKSLKDDATQEQVSGECIRYILEQVAAHDIKGDA